MSDRSMLAEIYVEPWRLLLQPKMAGDGRVAFAALSAMSWLVTAGTLFVLGWLAFFLLDDTGRPVVTYEGVVISRSWRPAFASVTTAPVISSNGQVGATVVPDYEPERYTVCMRVEEQMPCTQVRPARFEVLQPGTRVIVLAYRGRVSGKLHVTDIIEDDEVLHARR